MSNKDSLMKREAQDVKTMFTKADYAVTIEPDQAADLDHIARNSWWWAGWRRRHWPADIISRGLRLYAFNTKSRCFVAVLKITKCESFTFRTRAEFIRRVRATIRGLDTDHPHLEKSVGDGRTDRTGIAVRWKLAEKIHPIHWAGKFPQLGWMRLTEFPPEKAIDIGGNSKPERVATKQSRIVRETALIRDLKNMHDNKCQLCGKRLKFPNGSAYSEGHHLRPLGKPHNGPDLAKNILILCPNCHTLCDFGAVRLNAQRLRQHDGHVVAGCYIRYHNRIAEKQGHL